MHPGTGQPFLIAIHSVDNGDGAITPAGLQKRPRLNPLTLRDLIDIEIKYRLGLVKIGVIIPPVITLLQQIIETLLAHQSAFLVLFQIPRITVKVFPVHILSKRAINGKHNLRLAPKRGRHRFFWD